MAADPAQPVGPAELESSRPLNVRTFFGLPIPETYRDELGHFITGCAAAAPTFRWTPVSNLHLTVRFIGTIKRETVDRIADRIGAVEPAAFELALGDLGTFKRGRLVRVVWIGLRSGGAAASALAAQVEAECVRAGLVGEARAFQAHLTLARARQRDGSMLPPLPPVPQLGPWRTTELVLYSSQLSRTGAIYEPIRTLPLKS
jgi:RNA 2',3'-cyclic 3'-phosphodiesterase